MPRPPKGETEISLAAARTRFVNQPSLDTLKRWLRDGYGARGKGPVVFLDGYRDGKCYITTEQAVDRFKDGMRLRSQSNA